MTARPCYDWTPVGYLQHPIPGDSDAVLQGVREFRTTAGHLRDAARGLSTLEAADQTESEALDTLDDDMRHVIAVLYQALDRYEDAADALASYAPALLRAQQQAEQALQAATQSRQQYEQAARSANDMRWQIMTTIDPDQRRELLQSYHHARARASDAQADYIGAEDRIQDAIHDAKVAGDHAADRLQSSINNKDLNDSLVDVLKELGGQVLAFFDSAGKLIADLVKKVLDLDLLWDVLNWASLALTVVGAVLMFTPLAPVGAALLLAGRIVGAVTIVKSLYDLHKGFVKGSQTGDFSDFWLEGGLMLVGLVGGKGIGKVLAKSARRERKALFDGVVKRDGFVKAVTTAQSPPPLPIPFQKAAEFIGVARDAERRTADNLYSVLNGIPDHQGTAVMSAVHDAANAGKDLVIDSAKNLIESAKDHSFRDCRQPVGSNR